MAELFLPQTLDELCRRLSEAEDLRAGIEAVAWACDGAFPFYRVVAALPAQQAGRLYVAVAWARRPEEELAGFDFSLQGHPLERAVRERVPVVRTDPGSDHEDPRLMRLYRGEGKAEELAVPLFLGERTGLLIFASREAGSYGSRASRWAESVARILSLWIRPWAGQDAPLALKEQYETLIEGALDGIAVLRDGEILYANPSFHEIFGLEPLATPRSFDDLLDAGSKQSFAEAVRWLDQQPRLLPRLEVAGKEGRGRSLHLDVGLQTILFQGAPAFLLQVHNATDRALREQEVRRAREHTDALLLTLAHDIRAPLTTVLGFSELLVDRWGALTEDKALEMLRVLRRSSQSLQDIVEGLLEYGALGKSSAPPLLVDLGALLGAVEREIEGLLRHTGGALEYGSLPAQIWGRQVEMARVFRNLVENALKYGRPGIRPVVSISCRDDEDGYQLFCVADNGIGIDPSRRREVFELFRKGEGGGAGAGLAIVSRIIAGHGGRIWIEGDVGEGSRVYFTLPRRAPPRAN